MPAKVKDLERVAKKLGFQKTRQKGSHARWKHPDGRATTIPFTATAKSADGSFTRSSNSLAFLKRNSES
jgi:predicted RNA binding protein YcfA (HicA-like mRNA interferase family)